MSAVDTAGCAVVTVGIYLTEGERGHLTRLCNELEVLEQSALRRHEGPEAETRAAERAALRKLMYLPAALPVVSETWPRRVDAWQTSDRELYRSQAQAEDHQRNIDGAQRATAMLEAGSSLGDALRAAGLLIGDRSDLDEIFASTKLVIEHWQCRSEPGYQPVRVTTDGMVFVAGHAGSWSGPYGSTCTVSEVAGYWRDTKQRAERAKGVGR